MRKRRRKLLSVGSGKRSVVGCGKVVVGLQLSGFYVLLLASLMTISSLVPPDIDDHRTSSDVVTSEGHDAALNCFADGHPK